MKKTFRTPLLLCILLATLTLGGCLSLPTLRLQEPAMHSEVSTMRLDWQELLAERKAIVVKPGEVLEYKDNKGFPEPIRFTWVPNLPPPYTLELSRDGFRSIDHAVTVQEPHAEIYNLETGRKYSWRVKAAGEQSAVGSFTTADTGIRQIFVASTGPVNVRDWGGKHIIGGGRTRQGILYRGTQMQKPFELTDAARKVMIDELGIRTDLDLRYENDVAKMTGSPLGPQVKWLHYAINAYNSFKPENRAAQFPLWRDTFRVFADADNFPVYFHCFGGVDRTGEVALLLNFLLGVDEEQAFLDYEMSSLAHFPRKRDIAYLQEWLASLATFAPEGATRQTQAEQYLLAIGLTEEEIISIRNNLSEETTMTIHVSPSGNDAANGSVSQPLATLEAAVNRIRNCKEPSEIILHGGIHRLSNTLTLTSVAAPLTIRGREGETAIIDSGIELDGWKRVVINGKDAWEANAPLPIKRMYYNGKALSRAAFPKQGALYRVRDDEPRQLFDHNDHFLPQEGSFNPAWKDINGIEVCLFHYWINEFLPVTSYDATTGQVHSGSLSCFAINKGNAEYRFENVREALLENGEFYYDAARGTVTVILDADLSDANAVKPTCPAAGAALLIRDSSNVTLKNLTFRHSGAFTPQCTAELDLRLEGTNIYNYTMDGCSADPCWIDGDKPFAAAPQAAANVPGSVIFEKCRKCQVEGCVFEASGWYGLQIVNGCQEITIDRNKFRNLGAGGIRVDGAHSHADESLRTSRVTITNNHIHDCGQTFMGSIGIFVSNAYGNLIEHNHIHDLYYSGISVGWVWGYTDSVSRENRIGWNRIHDLGKDAMLSDMGGIYLLGIQPGTRVYNNFIAHITRRYYGGWGIYTDEGSSHIVVENNIAADCASNAFHQHYGRENILRWNIFAFGNDETLRMSRGNEHVNCYPGENFTSSITSYQNVFLTEGKPFIGSGKLENLQRPTFISDGNIYWDMAQNAAAPFAHATTGDGADCSLDEWLAQGQDAGAHFTDPCFRDPKRLDFFFPSSSPLAKMHFPMLDLAQVGIIPTVQK